MLRKCTIVWFLGGVDRQNYHFLADLDVTRHARETEIEKRIRNTPNKPFRVELVTSRNSDYRLYAISEHSFFSYRWEFTDGFVQGKPNNDEYFWIRSSAELGNQRNDKESAWIIVETYVTFSIDFPNIHITIICLPMLLIHFFRYFGKWRRFLPTGAYAFLTSSLHIPVNTVFNQIW